MAKSLGVYLTFILRHKPESIGLEMDTEGWVSIQSLIEKSQRQITFDRLMHEVAQDEKGRFQVSADQIQIRCVQGHSTLCVKREYPTAIPPDVLYHGTSADNLDSILSSGLNASHRHHLHLSNSLETAIQVGSRRKQELVVLEIDSGAMHREGHTFFISENNVWLIEFVPQKYLTVKGK